MARALAVASPFGDVLLQAQAGRRSLIHAGALEAERAPLDEKFPEWGESPYFRVRLQHTLALSEALTHLYVLLPVLDNSKHYWVGRDEVEKLLRRGEGWLAGHPARDLITLRYLRHRCSLTRQQCQVRAAEPIILQQQEAERARRLAVSMLQDHLN